MPINSNKVVESISFDYVNENDENYILNIVFHHTEELGPTVSITNFGSGNLSFPASLFGDVVDFLRSRKAINSPDNSFVPNRISKLAPTRTSQSQSLPNVPSVSKSPDSTFSNNQYNSQASVLTSGAIEHEDNKTNNDEDETLQNQNKEDESISLKAGLEKKKVALRPKRVIKKTGDKD